MDKCKDCSNFQDLDKYYYKCNYFQEEFGIEVKLLKNNWRKVRFCEEKGYKKKLI